MNRIDKVVFALRTAIKTIDWISTCAWPDAKQNALSSDSRAKRACADAAVTINMLRDWIRKEGVRTDSCTYNVLGEICNGCRCSRSKSA